MNHSNCYTALLLNLVLIVFFTSVNAQVVNPKETARQKGEERANQKIDEGVDAGLNKIEEGIGSLFKKKKKKKEKREKKGVEETGVNASGTENNADENKPGTTTATLAPQLQSTSQYDFVPGDQVLYFEDFSQDAIGDFPALWASNSSGEVKNINIAEGHWFHMDAGGGTYIPLNKINFPDNFIIEFDLVPNIDYEEFQLTIYEEEPDRELNDDLYPGKGGVHISPNTEYAGGWFARGYYGDRDWLEGHSEKNPVLKEQLNHIIIWVQKRRLRIYHRGAKALDVPLCIYPETKFNRFRFFGWNADGSKPFISNIKVTTAAPDTRSKLITEGRLVTYGITFDVNKADIKPESHGTLKSIADVLNENAGVKVKIVGHTDSDGDDALNLDLSGLRAEAVKNELSKNFGIEASRMETEGAGESNPAAPNDTAENKARNRRVEFVKL